MLRLLKSTEISWLTSLSRVSAVVREASTEFCSKVKIICWMVAADKELFSWTLHHQLQKELTDHLQCLLFLLKKVPSGKICGYRNYAAKRGSAIMQCYASYLEVLLNSNSNGRIYVALEKNSIPSNLMHIIQTLAKDLFEESIYLLNSPCNFQFSEAAVDGMMKTEDNVGTKKKTTRHFQSIFKSPWKQKSFILLLVREIVLICMYWFSTGVSKRDS